MRPSGPQAGHPPTDGPARAPIHHGRSRPKILIVVPAFPAVSETFVVDHVVGLTDRGWEVTVASTDIDESALVALRKERGVPPDVRVLVPRALRIPTKILRAAWDLRLLGPTNTSLMTSKTARSTARASGAVLDIAREVRPDLIHAHFGPIGIQAARAARRLRVPLVVDFHGYDVTILPHQDGWRLYRLLPSSTLAVVHSPFVEELIRAHLPLSVSRVTLGVDLTVFSPRRREEKWPVPLNLLTVGRLLFQKGHHLAIEALALLRHRYPHLDARLTICGGGPAEPALRDLARLLGLSDVVFFLGPVRHGEAANQMRVADILLVPSLPTADGWQEAFCRVAIEGLAAGLPVFGTDCGGLASTIGDGGIVVRPSTAGALAGGVADLVEHTSPAAACRRATARAARFSINEMLDDYERVALQALRV